MGIQKLHSFMQNNCQECIHEVHIKMLRNTRVAIDVSMFLYKFKQNGNLIHNMFALCSLLRTYNIHPIFVFDGKPSDEKLKCIEKRRFTKLEMLKKMEELKQMDDDPLRTEQIAYYKKQSMFITKDDIVKVRMLFELYGMTWVRSNEEADSYISYLSLYNHVDYVISDDTDMFAYGCMHVLRNFDLVSQTMLYYNTQEILDTLSLTMEEFQNLCSKSKNDYIYHKQIKYFSDNYSIYQDKKKLPHIQTKPFFHVKKSDVNDIPNILNKTYDKNALSEFIKAN